jgi:hypothetical protein
MRAAVEHGDSHGQPELARLGFRAVEDGLRLIRGELHAIVLQNRLWRVKPAIAGN